jgi:aldehyde:ferredoxin oxidoreductase
MNTTNLKNNATYGDLFQLPKPPTTTRLISLNINGFRRGNDFQDALETVQAQKISSVDMWAFQETDVNWRSSCLRKCYKKCRKVYHHTRLSTSSSIVNYRTLYQPGGTMTAVTDDYVGRVMEIGSDNKMGRCSYI